MSDSTKASTQTPGGRIPRTRAFERVHGAGFTRIAGRVGVGVVCASGSLLAVAGPAFAEKATQPAKPLGLLKTLGLFVGVPVGLFALISLLVVAAQLKKRPSAEPDLAWYDDAVSDRPIDAPEVGSGDGSGTTDGSQPGHGQAPA